MTERRNGFHRGKCTRSLKMCLWVSVAVVKLMHSTLHIKYCYVFGVCISVCLHHQTCPVHFRLLWSALNVHLHRRGCTVQVPLKCQHMCVWVWVCERQRTICYLNAQAATWTAPIPDSLHTHSDILNELLLIHLWEGCIQVNSLESTTLNGCRKKIPLLEAFKGIVWCFKKYDYSISSPWIRR